MYDVLNNLKTDFQVNSGHKLSPVLATPKEMSSRIGNGEAVDVVMSGGPLIETLVQRGKIVSESKVVVARVGMGVAVRAGAAKPDISSIEAFRRTLLAAKSIVYSDPASGGTTGIYFEKVLDRLGIAKEIKAKAILNAPTATPNTEVVARGKAELGIQLISEIVSIPGAELLGPFPGDLQRPNVLLAGIATSAPEPAAAKALLKFMTSPIAAKVIRKSGMETGG